MNGATMGSSPFWRFLDELTVPLLGGPHFDTRKRWGWSNLLKIGGSQKNLISKRDAEFIKIQREACKQTLQEEFAQLSRSLIFIGSNDEFGILRPILNEEASWDKHDDSGLLWKFDARSGNLFVHGYHPKATLRWWDKAVKVTLDLAEAYLSFH